MTLASIPALIDGAHSQPDSPSCARGRFPPVIAPTQDRCPGRDGPPSSRQGDTMKAYCVKCKAKKEMKDAKETTMKTGRKAMKGVCPSCGTGMYCILPGSAAKPPAKKKAK